MIPRSPGRPAARGFTLIELMVAMLVSGIVVLGIFAFSTIQRSTAAMHERSVRVQQALEGAMWSVAQDLRLAGMPFARMCTELRVYDPSNGGRLLNPGGAVSPASAVRDAQTGEHYWVFRDGVQAHWNSSAASSIAGSEGTSASPDSAADSLDVLVADAVYTESLGLFQLSADITTVSTSVQVRTGPGIDSSISNDLAEVRQLFPPGSFILVVRDPSPQNEPIPLRPDRHGQCVLLQVTSDIAPGPTPQEWLVPIGPESGFNRGLGLLLADNNGTATCTNTGECDDWNPGMLNGYSASTATSWIVPIGRLRWSRYSIDYTIPQLPYLVRSDLIGFQEGDPDNWGSVDYPDCAAGRCRGPQLHLPGSEPEPQAIAIGPMIEDMQVAVGCDGYTVGPNGNEAPVRDLEPPEPGFEEPLSTANRQVDEVRTNRGADEWLGNARSETWAPDCVYYGTGEYAAAAWQLAESGATPAYRMSPQTLRITLLGSSEYAEEAGGIATDMLQAIEDRPPMASSVGPRQRFFVSERFTPENLRWRDPAVL